MTLLTVFLLLISAAITLFAALFLIFEFYAIVIGVIKGAPFIRSSKKKIKIMLELADIKPGDKVMDPGSGDGTLLLEAAQLGAQTIGIEINPFLVFYSRLRAKRAGLTDKIKLIRKNFFDYPLHDADVIFLYLWPRTNELLKEKLETESKSGTKIISSAFIIPGWRPAKEKDGVFLYIKQ